ncbi:MAG: PepSY-like domain-containing protein [Muribaculaceae bacterium]|nr:PepSY-like domain-containing protein [Muribaculaceae bacterium]
MKKLLLSLAIVALICVSRPMSARKKSKKVVLPKAAMQFINTHYSGEKISHIEWDTDATSAKYEVKLANGDEVTFDANGQWTEVETAANAMIPRTILPDTVYKYIAFKYPKLNIVEANTNTVGYKVELSNGVELIFSSTGKFIRKNK